MSKKEPSLEDSENSLKHQYCVKRDHGGNLASRLVRVWFVLNVWVHVWFVVRKQVHSLKWVVRKFDLRGSCIVGCGCVVSIVGSY